MRRLKDLDAPASPIEADAADLLRSAAGYEPAPGQKQRVRARLLQARVRRSVKVSRPAIAVVVILCAAAASAAVGRRWIAQRLQVFGTTRAASTTASHATRKLAAAEGQRQAPDLSDDSSHDPGQDEPAWPAPEARIEAAGGATHNGAGAAKRSRGARLHAARAPRIGARMIGAMTRVQKAPAAVASLRSRREDDGSRGQELAASTRSAGAETPAGAPPSPAVQVRPTSAVAAAGAAGYAAGRTAGREARPESTPPSIATIPDETGLVFEAMRALRQEKRPTRASRLLDEYLRRHPEGSLCEEALALSIEAAAMRGDVRTRDLVAKYLERYPAGHFRAAVELTRARLRR